MQKFAHAEQNKEKDNRLTENHQADKSFSGSLKDNARQAADEQEQRKVDEEQHRLAQKANKQDKGLTENLSQENHQKNQVDSKKPHTVEQKSDIIDGVSGGLKSVEVADKTEDEQKAEDLRSQAMADTFRQVQEKFSEIELKYADKFAKWNTKHPNKSAMGERFYWDYINEQRATLREFHEELNGLNIKVTDLPQEIQDWDSKTHFHLNVMNEQPLGNVYPEFALVGGGRSWLFKDF